MIELLLILLTITIFFLISYIPFYRVFNFNNNFNFVDSKLLNILCFITLILLLNLLNIKLSLVIYSFYCLILASFFYYIFKFKHNLPKINKENFLLVSIIFLLTLIISINIAYFSRLEWNAQTIWIDKTILIAYDNTISSFKSSPASELPFLFPIIWSFFWKLININYEYLGRLFVIFIYLFSIYSVISLLKINFTKKIVFFLITLLLTLKLEGFQGELSVLTLSFIFIAVRYIYLLNNKDNNKFLLILTFFLAINLLIYTSNEGLFYSLILIGSIFFIKDLNQKTKSLMLILFVSLVILRMLFYFFYDFSFALNSDDYAFNHIIYNLSFSNILLITKYIFFNFLRSEFLIVCIFLIFLNFIFSSPQRKLILYLLITNLLFIYSFFLFNEETIEYMLKGNTLELLYISSGIYTLPVIHFLNSKYKNV